GVAAGAPPVAGATTAGSEPEKSPSPFDLLLPGQKTKKEIGAIKGGTTTKHEIAGATFLGRSGNLRKGAPDTPTGVYAPAKDGIYHRSLSAESWAAGNIAATVDVKTGMLELRERANSDLKGQLVLSCNLRTVGMQYSVRVK